MSEAPDKQLSKTAPGSMPEVDFALMLSRLILAAKTDPAQLRSSVYELARIKLQQQFTREEAREISRMKQALETAISGVEAFSQKMDLIEASKVQPVVADAPPQIERSAEPERLPASEPKPATAEPTPQMAQPDREEPQARPTPAIADSAPHAQPVVRRARVERMRPTIETFDDDRVEILPVRPQQPEYRKPVRTYQGPSRAAAIADTVRPRPAIKPRGIFWPLRALMAIASVALVITAAIYIHRHQAVLVKLRTLLPTSESASSSAPTPMPSGAVPAATLADRASEAGNAAPPAPAAIRPAARDPLIPTIFGVYAINGDRLFPLEQLPGRAPDIRVAVSAPILTPSRTALPDGKVRFVVYRRDVAGGAPERAEVRVVAKVKPFVAKGATTPQDAEESWAMRNAAFPFSVGPMANDPDMYNVRPEADGLVLSPGRYALVFKGAIYDFVVEGRVTDPQQCMERVNASNGNFYAPCRMP